MMNAQTDPFDQSVSDGPEWPNSSLFFFGYFGRKSPGGRRLVRETTAALALLLVGGFILGYGAEHVVLKIASALAFPVAVAWMARSHLRYLQGLDELSRTIQLKAFAFSYFIVMLLAALWAGVAMATPAAAGISPVAIFVLLVVAEPVRGMALVFLARKYG